MIRGFIAGRSALMAENLALRQQLIVLQRSVKRTRLRPRASISVWADKQEGRCPELAGPEWQKSYPLEVSTLVSPLLVKSVRSMRQNGF